MYIFNSKRQAIFLVCTFSLEPLTILQETTRKFHPRGYQSLHKRMKFHINNLFTKRKQGRRKLQICLHLLNKSLKNNFSFCAVSLSHYDYVIFAPKDYDFTTLSLWLVYKCTYVWLWVRVHLQSLEHQILRLLWARSFFTFRKL